MTLYRLICALGQQRLVAVLVKCRLALPVYILAGEKHSRCVTDRVYLPAIGHGSRETGFHVDMRELRRILRFILVAMEDQVWQDGIQTDPSEGITRLRISHRHNSLQLSRRQQHPVSLWAHG
jgi:hypothetical protein